MHIARPLNHRTFARSTAALLLIAAAACGDGPTGSSPVVQPPRPAVAEVDVSATELVLPVGDQHQLYVYVKAADGTVLTGRAVAWASSDTAVVSVDATGRLTARRAGAAVVSATSEGKRGEALVTVPQPVATVAINAATLTIKPGESRQLEATLVSPDGQVLTDRLVSWITSDPTVLAVDPHGKVTGLRGGSAWIHAWSEGKSDSVRVWVSMTANPDQYHLISVDGQSLGIAMMRVDSISWTDAQGVAHPAEVVISGGTLTFVRGGAQLRYEQRITISTYLLDAPAFEIRFPVAETVLVDRGEVTERPWAGTDYLFRSSVIPNHHLFTGVGIGVERLRTDQAINGQGPERRLIFSQW